MLEDLVAHDDVERAVIERQAVGVLSCQAESAGAGEFRHVRPVFEFDIASERVVAQAAEAMNHVAIAAPEVQNPRTWGNMAS